MDKIDTPKCKARVWPRGEYHSVGCSKDATRDGFCGIHHPDAKKRRDEKWRAEYERKQAASPHARIATLERELSQALARVAELEGALREIAKPIEGVPIGDPWAFYSDLQAVARAALKEKS